MYRIQVIVGSALKEEDLNRIISSVKNKPHTSGGLWV
jgi:hypothetical protein